jgi:ribosomal protein L18
MINKKIFATKKKKKQAIIKKIRSINVPLEKDEIMIRKTGKYFYAQYNSFLNKYSPVFYLVSKKNQAGLQSLALQFSSKYKEAINNKVIVSKNFYFNRSGYKYHGLVKSFYENFKQNINYE